MLSTLSVASRSAFAATKRTNLALSSALANGFRGTCAIVLSRILAVPPNHSSSVFIMGVFTGGPGQRQFSLTRAQVQGRGSSSGHQPGVRRTVSYSDNVALPSLAHSECRVTYDVEPPQHAAALTQALDPLLLGLPFARHNQILDSAESLPSCTYCCCCTPFVGCCHIPDLATSREVPPDGRLSLPGHRYSPVYEYKPVRRPSLRRLRAPFYSPGVLSLGTVLISKLANLAVSALTTPLNERPSEETHNQIPDER